MKILILNWRGLSHPQVGGAEIRLFQVYSRLVAKGHKVRLHCSGFDGGSDFETLKGIEVFRHGGDSFFQLQCIIKLRSWIREYEPDIVVEDFNKLPFFSKLLHGQPKLIQVHHLWKKSIFKESNFAVALLVWTMEQSLRFFYHRVPFCSVSESTTKELHEYSINPKKVTTIHNGFQWDWLEDNQDELGQEFMPSLVKPYFIWLGRLQRYKGIDDAIDGFEKFCEDDGIHDLYIAGSGPDASRLKEKVKLSKVRNRIHFLGYVDEITKFKWIKHAKALIQTSYKEGWGLTVIEANSVNTIVVANNAPGLVDSVQDKKTGFLYDFGDSDSLAEKLTYIVENPEELSSLEEQAFLWAKNFTWDRCALETEKLISEIIE